MTLNLTIPILTSTWIFLSCCENPTPETCDNKRTENESLEEKSDKVPIKKRLLEDKSDKEILDRLAKAKGTFARVSAKSYFDFSGTQSELDKFLKLLSEMNTTVEYSIFIPKKSKGKYLEGIIETGTSPEFLEGKQLLIQEYQYELDFRKNLSTKKTLPEN